MLDAFARLRFCQLIPNHEGTSVADLQCAQNPVPIGVGYLAQYIVKPLLGYAIAKVCFHSIQLLRVHLLCPVNAGCSGTSHVLVLYGGSSCMIYWALA